MVGKVRIERPAFDLCALRLPRSCRHTLPNQIFSVRETRARGRGQEAEDGLVLLQSRLGVWEDGWVENEHYDDAVAQNEDFTRGMMETLLEGPDKDELMAVWLYRPEGIA